MISTGHGLYEQYELFTTMTNSKKNMTSLFTGHDQLLSLFDESGTIDKFKFPSTRSSDQRKSIQSTIKLCGLNFFYDENSKKLKLCVLYHYVFYIVVCMF